MINPYDLFDYDPLDRSKLSMPSRVFVVVFEYFVRVLGAVVFSFTLMLLSVMPFRRATDSFFSMIGMIVSMRQARKDKEEKHENNGSEAMAQGDGR